MADQSQFPLSQATNVKKGLSPSRQSPLEGLSKAKSTQTTSLIPEGTETPQATELPKAEEVYITTQPPENVAILHIYPDGKDEYLLWGRNLLSKELEQSKPKARPDISLGEQVTKGTDPRLIKWRMQEFSKNNTHIRKWIKTLIERFENNLCLVISDYTGFEIPWEMLELSPGESPNQYIGALITTVRWRKIIFKDDELVLEFNPDKCSGRTVAYVLKELEGAKDEIEVLEELKAKIYHSDDDNSMEEFHTHLRSDCTDHSFVYISCHGNFTSNPEKMYLGPGLTKELTRKLDEKTHLTLETLNKHPLHLLKKYRGIVFINACHSAREQVHPLIPDEDYRRGFIQIFLEQGARGVIATLGEVGQYYAAELACELMRESSKSSTCSVAEILKNLRLKAIEDLGNNPTKDQLLRFVFRFMYVYYGNPKTVLWLTPQGE